MLTEDDARELMTLRSEKAAIEERISELTALAQDMGEDTYALGDYKVVTTVTRRFDPKKAEDLLTQDEIDEILDIVVSPSKAKKHLTPIRYAACMKDYGVQAKITKPKETDR